MSLEGLPGGADLERLLEAAEMAQYQDFFQALPSQVGEELGIQMDHPGGLLRLTATNYDHPMFNRVMGVTGGGEGELEAVLSQSAAHYRAAGVRRWMLQLLPHMKPSGFREVAAPHGVVPLRGWAKHLGSAALDPAPAPGVRIIRLGSPAAAEVGREAELAQGWAELLAEVFGFPAPFVSWLQALHGRKGWHLYLALDGDQPVATGGLFLAQSPAGMVGQLTFGGTHPAYRRQGYQSAMIGRRVEDARAAGARWIVSETDEDLPDRPNPSTRNLVRLGFPVVYVRENWGPPKPES